MWLVNQPVKVARLNGQVWLEVHPPVDAEGQSAEVDLEGFYALANAALGETPAAIHWDFVLSTLQEASGLPQMVGLEIDPDALPPEPATPAEAAPGQPAPESPAAPANEAAPQVNPDKDDPNKVVPDKETPKEVPAPAAGEPPPAQVFPLGSSRL